MNTPKVRALCLWCRHNQGWHDGKVPQDVKEKFEGVVWTNSACSKLDCIGCRRYER